jgi:hypothetical protein
VNPIPNTFLNYSNYESYCCFSCVYYSEWETPTWPPSIQMGYNRWNILGFNFTKRDALSSLYKISIYRHRLHEPFGYIKSVHYAILYMQQQSILNGIFVSCFMTEKEACRYNDKCSSILLLKARQAYLIRSVWKWKLFKQWIKAWTVCF